MSDLKTPVDIAADHLGDASYDDAHNRLLLQLAMVETRSSSFVPRHSPTRPRFFRTFLKALWLVGGSGAVSNKKNK